MEMVAASKMRKSQERMAASRPYADTMRKVIGHLANGNLEYKHPYRKNATLSAWATGGVDRPWSAANINLFKKLLAERHGPIKAFSATSQ